MKIRRIKIGLAILMTFVAIHSGSSQISAPKIDSLLQSMFQPDGPGGAFLIAKNGKTIYKKAFGMANLELNVAMKPENVFQIGSMTKQFTAIAINDARRTGKIKCR